VGRRLDFLSQELGRELNTMGSKSATAELSAAVVEGKAVLEKLREQVQNVE
jgi:large subunit ribosomal protein L28